MSARGGRITGAVRWRYAGSKVPLAAGERQTRHFGLWLARAQSNERFGRSVDAFFRLMLPDVPPGPKWLREIAMVDYDYLSDGGRGFENDVKELARLLTPEERRRTADLLSRLVRDDWRLCLRRREEGDETAVGGDG